MVIEILLSVDITHSGTLGEFDLMTEDIKEHRIPPHFLIPFYIKPSNLLLIFY